MEFGKRGKFFTKAYTLSELLLTLGIIGAITLITLKVVQSVQDFEFKIGYKKTFSIASQAWQNSLNNNEIVYRTGWTDSIARAQNFKSFKSNFIVVKDCDGTIIKNSNCWDTRGEGFNGFTSPPNASAPAFIDASGTAWVDEGSGSGIMFDTNGFKAPNRYGKDRFRIKTCVDNDVWTPGIPVKIKPDADYKTKNAAICNYPPCYNTTWLK